MARFGFSFDPDEDSGIGLTNVIFFGISGIAILLFMLNEAQQCDDAFKFCSILIFSIVLLYSFAWIGIMAMILTKKSGKESIDFYFLQELTIGKFLLVFPALAGVFVVSFWAVEIGIPLVGIFLSGIIMSSVFLITKSAIPSILIHAFYNDIVLYLRSTSSGLEFISASQSPIRVPEIGVTFFNNELVTELLTHTFLIAPAEEMFRIFVIFLFILVYSARWDPTSIRAKVFGMIIATALWSVYHLPIAL